jgi:hypothetical protein
MSKKNTAKAANAAVATPNTKLSPDRLRDHDHIHAANCGHKSFVHGDHIDYQHEGHYHYVQNGQTFMCNGPDAKVLQFDTTKNKNKK